MSSDAQDAQERVHRAVRGFVGDIDRRFLRPMELETHLAAADCCRDTESSTEKVHACIEKSQSQALRAQQYMQAEMQRFQVGNEIRVTCNVLGGAATCSEGFVNYFLRVPQTVGLYCSCHAAQASKGNF